MMFSGKTYSSLPVSVIQRAVALNQHRCPGSSCLINLLLARQLAFAGGTELPSCCSGLLPSRAVLLK